MAASSISRKTNLRQLYRSFSAISLLQQPQWRSFHPSRLIPQQTLNQFLPFHVAQADNRLGQCRIQSLPLSWHKFLCSSSAAASGPTATTSQSSSASVASSEANSDKGEKSGESNRTADEGKPVRGGPVSWLSFVLLIATGLGIIFYYDKEKKQHIEEISNSSNAVKQGPSVGKAAIGGPFKLIDHNGKAVTERSFLGKWTVIYFGFTHCPDICPDELIKLAAAVDKIKEKAGIEIVPLFISVDPERDTVEQVGEYVKEFHPTLIGLTGSTDEVKEAARAFRVYYMKTEEEGSDYLVDHSIIMYLMDPDMEFVKFFGKNYDADMLADGIIKEIKQHQKVKA